MKKLNKQDSVQKVAFNEETDLMGPRKLPKTGKKQEIFDTLAVNFITRLQDSFDDFKEYCNNIDHPDCAILDTDWSDFGEF